MLLLRIIQTLVDLVFSARYQVVGGSMLPNLPSGQYVLAASVRLPWNRLRRGDIVVLRHPVERDRIYIKRVVGLPDEYIRLARGRVYIDDIPMAEPYLYGAQWMKEGHARKWFTGRDEYFVLGDNRNSSQDSLTFGPIPQALIVGRVWLRCWPPLAWGKIAGKSRHP